MPRCYDCGADIPPGKENQALVDFIPAVPGCGYDVDFYKSVCHACAEKRRRRVKEWSWLFWLLLLAFFIVLGGILYL